MNFLSDGPDDATTTIAFAHGAGAPMDSDFMQVFAERLGDTGSRVVRFEFPYMVERRETRGKKPPDRLPQLIKTWSKKHRIWSFLDEIRPQFSPMSN